MPPPKARTMKRQRTVTKRDGNASDPLRKQAAGNPQDELVAGSSGQPESIQPEALLAHVLDRANLQRALKQVRQQTRRTKGTRIGAVIAELRETLLGWKAYFGIAEVMSPLRDIDKWIRRKLRCHLWKQWGPKGYRELRKRGVSVRQAWNTSNSAHGPWRLSKTPALALALPVRYFANLGLPNLAPRQEFNSSNRRIRDPYVRWCGRGKPGGFLLSRLSVAYVPAEVA